MRNSQRTSLGTFKKLLPIWTPETWDAGWVDNKGYFRVYRPDYPRAWPSGYAKRYHVVYWLRTGAVPPKNMILHHKNEIKLDDRFENLVLEEHGEHSKHHNIGKPKPRPAGPYESTHTTRQCLYCKQEFGIETHRLREKGRGSYCGQSCYHKSKIGKKRPDVSARLKLWHASKRS